MSQQIVSTWDGVANTNSWVHDGDVERSAVDIVELASSVAGYSAGAQAAADAASGYADTASAAVASIGTAATDAVQAVQDEGAAQMSALVDAGGVQSALIGSAGAAQISNIVTSGGVVTSAIADAGSAEIADIVSAGGAQVALVSAAGTSATGDLAAVTAAQSAALVSAGGYQSGLIATAGSAQIAAVQAEGGTQIAAVQLAASAQVDSATSAAIIATSAANTAETVASGAVAAITSTGAAQVQAVNSAGGIQSAAVVSAGSAQISLVTSTGATQSAAVVSAGGAQITAVNSAGAVQSAAVVSAGAAQITSIGSAGAAQISAVTSTGGVQVGLVQSAGTAQIAIVQSAGAAEVQAIEDAGEVYQAQIDDNAQRIENINGYAEGQLYTYETDSTEAYVKSVPDGVVQNAEVQSIAGKTVVWNQLCKNDYPSNTVNDVTFTKNNDGSWTIDGTASANGQVTFASCPVVSGHKYLVEGCPSGGGSTTYWLGISGVGIDTGSGGIWTSNTTATNTTVRFDFKSGATFDNVTIYPQAHDLTLLYGAGNEPTTVEQFRAEFPADYYAYSPGTLISAGVTDVVSIDADNNTLATLTIPASVQALPGYGWSAGSAKNVLDLENGKYIQNVGAVDLGTLNYDVYDSSGFVFAYGKTVLSNVKIPVGGDDVANVICAKYVAASYNGCIGGHVDKQIGIIFSTSRLAGKIFLSDSTYTTAADLKAALSGVMLYYELATPVITDISELLTPGSYLAVEEGGTITFQNSNGSDYRIPVESSVRYQEGVDLAGRVPDAPSTDGTYTLQCTVADGVPTYSWVSA